MPKNKNQHQLDAIQCQKLSFDANNDAIRIVNVLDSQHNIEISADQGDSIAAMAKARCLKPEDGEIDCSQMRKICGFNEASVSISPDGITWIPWSINNQAVLDLCVIKIKVLSGVVVVRS
jgi:hypothetical protein